MATHWPLCGNTPNHLTYAVIGELLATKMYAIMDKAQHVHDPWERIATYTSPTCS
jgi:hypothetical protein